MTNKKKLIIHSSEFNTWDCGESRCCCCR